MSLILNIDDTESMRYAKTRALLRAGFDVVEAGTGAEGLALAAERHPALVMLDVKLPDISGLEVCRRIKQNYPSMPVLHTSASFVETEDRVAGLEGGADAYLTQPIGADELVASVRALLRTGAAAQALRATNETLERRVQNSARELTDTQEALQSEIRERERAQDALRQSQKMEALGQLTGGIAHDFNNLLQGIIGNLQFLLRKLPADLADPTRHAEDALSSANRAALLTQRLLAFSRRQSLQPAMIGLDDLIDEAAELIRRSVGESIDVVIRRQSETWPVWCDSNQMVNALLNVGINARDAMSAGGTLTVETANVRLTPEDAVHFGDLVPGEYVKITVQDTGTGMPPDVLAQAFEPFFTTKPIGQGTGLGLSMVYGFIKQSKGLARIQSAPGKGTSVCLYLPRFSGEPPLLEDEVALDEQRADMRGAGNILVVEDEPIVRNLVVQVLQDEGFTVLEAEDGQLALTMLESGAPIQLLVTDVGLPGMNGRQLAEIARKTLPDLKILFTTGYAHNAVLDDLDLLEGAEMIGKPFKLDELAARVHALMQTD